jgi:hypothetical protein
MRTPARTAALTLAIVGLCVTAAPAQAPAPPINDNYLSSLELNRAGTKLNSTNTLVDNRDTTNATTQADVFNPPSSGGPAEPTTCQGVSYGKTVWYDFYPDRDGTVRLRTAGFDNVISLYTFDRKTLVPDVANRQCIHQSSAPAEELLASVKAGGAYTIQIGGVNGAGGPLQFEFDFVAAPPRQLSADATLKALAISGGVKILDLSAQVPGNSRVQVRCSRGCHTPVKHIGRPRTIHFPSLDGTVLHAGSKLRIFVTAPHAIGTVIQYNIASGNFTKVTRCVEPGSLKPRTSCS